MKLQVVLSEVSFNSPAHYFIKLSLTHDPQGEDSKSFQRTPVSPIVTKTPQFAQTTFYFELPPTHPLVDPATFSINKSLLKLNACLINQGTTPPSISVIGTVNVVVFPHKTLQRRILDMQIVYFHNESAEEVGKCIVTLSIAKSGEGASDNMRLDPLDSFLNLHPPLIKAKSQYPEKVILPPSSFVEKSPTDLSIKTPDKGVTPTASFLNKLTTLKTKNAEAASPAAKGQDKKPPILKIISETSDDYSIRDSDPDLLQVIAESYKSSPKQRRTDSLNNDDQGKEMFYDEHDIDQRQKLIDKLLEELDHRTNAVKKVGQDLYRLREKNAENEEIIMKLSKKLEESESVNAKILNTIDLDMLSVEELRKRYAILAARLQGSLAKNEELADILEGAQEKVIQRNEIEKRLLEIQQAHTSQQVYVQRLQDKLSDISRYRSTIKIQEQIIRKFESLLNESSNERAHIIKQDQLKDREQVKERKAIKEIPHVQDTPMQILPPEMVANQNALVASLERENRMLLSKIHDLEFSLQKAETKAAVIPPVQVKDDTLELFKMELEAERDALLQLGRLETKTKDSDECSDFALLLRAEKAEARVVALEQELEDSAIEFTQKVAKLEAEIRQLHKT